jgi:lipopolysaccharide export system permease protein
MQARKSTFGRSWKSRLPMKIADGYLLSAVFAGMLRGLMWFGGLLLVFSIMNAMSKVMRYSLPPLLMLQLVLYQLPRLVLFTLPAATLFGSVSAFTEMSGSGELTALGVGGMSLVRMLRVPLLFGILLSISAFILQENLVPWGESSYQRLVHDGSTALGAQKDLTIVDRDDDGQVQRIISAAQFIPATKTLIEPRIQIWNKDRQIATQIAAEKAQWDEANGKWIFYNGTQYFFPNAKPGHPNQSPSPITNHFSQFVVTTMPNPKAMNSKTISLQQNLEDQNYEMVPLSVLWKYRAKQAQYLQTAKTPQVQAKITSRTNSLTYGIHDKIATPLMCFIVILLGAPLGVRPQRSGSGFSIGLSLLVLLIYYVVWSAASNIGKQGANAPLFLAYLPLALVLGVGLVMLKKKSR